MVTNLFGSVHDPGTNQRQEADMKRITNPFKVYLLLLAFGALAASSVIAQEALFEYVGPADSVSLPEHAIAGQNVRVNRRAFQSPSILIDLFGESFVAERKSIDKQKAGQTIWVGHLQGNEGDSVILTLKGNTISGFIQYGFESYRIGASSAAGNRLYMLDLQLLPPEDVGGVPDGSGGATQPQTTEALADNTIEDLLVVYNQAACDSADSGNPGNDCSQLEADIVTAVADINAAYAASLINITLNLAGTHKTNYTGTGASATLSALRSTSDGIMDEVHTVRDSLGADIVSMIYNGEGCGIGYLSSSASSAFNVTDEPCVVGNRTMAHEIGHNQGAHHDRVTASAGTSSAYNYGYRRCSDGSVDDFGSPYYRTVLSYSCSSAPRVGRFSNPNVNYNGVPQGVDPDLNPTKGAHNARRLNETASYVAGFRTASSATIPNPPNGLTANAGGPDYIDLSWSDNSNDETRFELRRSPDNSSWSSIATLGANTTSYTDNGLIPEIQYFYQVRAGNSAGDSAWSSSANDTTLSLPPSINDVAYGETHTKGSVTNSYTATNASGGAVQSITEASSGGRKSARSQSYDHDWLFDVFGGAGGVIASVDAWVSGSEGANFYYSTDGGANLNLMFTVDNTTQGSPQTFTLPAGTSGQVRIIVQDASQSGGEPVDAVYIDHLFITSHTEAGSPPATPSGMSVTGTTSSSVSVEFNDNSEDEFGFELWRATSDPSGNCSAGSVVDNIGSSAGTGAVSHTDDSASASTQYWYWAVSYNGAGDNGSCSNADSGTTPAGSAISLSVNGYKVKGVKTVDLIWSGFVSTNVDVYREGAKIETIANSSSPWTDITDLKGGGSLTYKICEEGKTSASECSEEQTAPF
jgi:hypothetical protein